MTSAAVAVTLLVAQQAARSWLGFVLITLVFVYTTLTNVYRAARTACKIASWFIATIIVTSLISRVLRSTELRIHGVHAGRAGASVSSRKPADVARFASSRTGPTPACPRSTSASCATRAIAPPPARRARAVRRSAARATCRSSRGTLRSTGAEVGGYHVLRSVEPGDPERHCRPAARTSATRPGRSRTRTSAGPKATRLSTC